MSWTKKVRHPSEVLKKGEKVQVKVLSVDPDRKRVALGLKQLSQDPWESDIPERYLPDDLVSGVVTKTTSFGAFVELEEGLEGLLHISELADYKVENPEEVVRPGQQVAVKVLRVDPDERKIGLSLKRVPAEDQVLYQEVAAAAGPEFAGAEAEGTLLLEGATPAAESEEGQEALVEPEEVTAEPEQVAGEAEEETVAETEQVVGEAEEVAGETEQPLISGPEHTGDESMTETPLASTTVEVGPGEQDVQTSAAAESDVPEQTEAEGETETGEALAEPASDVTP